jgi:hypothetical protein
MEDSVNKTARLSVMLLGLLALAACGGAIGQASEPEPVVRLSEDFEGALPIQFQLLVGTFHLEATELAVDVAQATELIPLWQALRSLTGSDTAAEAEIDALIDQIQDTLSAEQLEAIVAMQLTQESLQAMIQELDLRPRAPEGSDGLGDFQLPPGGITGGGRGGFVGGGEGPGPGGGGVFIAPEDLDPDQRATLEARREEFGGFAGRAGQFLIDPLIELLEAKLATEV